MSVTIELTPEMQLRLAERARAAGTDPGQFALQVLKKALLQPDIDETLRPLREEVAASGVSEEEIDAMIEAEREDRFQGRN